MLQGGSRVIDEIGSTWDRDTRLRVARALRELPALADAFARGALAFSAVRELTVSRRRRPKPGGATPRPARTCARSRTWWRATAANRKVIL